MIRIAAFLLAAWACATTAAELDLDLHCLDCHRPGQARGEVPLIEGQQRDYLLHQLLRFKQHHRDAFPMTALTSGLDERTLESIAESLSLRPWREVPVAVPREAAKRGRERATARSCSACHGAEYLGTGDISRLAGQHPGYLARQIDAFAQGARYHPPTGTGAPMHTVGPDEAADLAAFLHSAAATSGHRPSE
jgi:cytochrome c553